MIEKMHIDNSANKSIHATSLPAPRMMEGVRRREMKKKTLMSWSSGKDSAWALHLLQEDPTIHMLGLFTVIIQNESRVAMHATRLEMLERQADAVGLPLQTISLPDPCTTEHCNAIIRQFVVEFAAKGIECMAYGDLFLEDIRRARCLCQ